MRDAVECLRALGGKRLDQLELVVVDLTLLDPRDGERSEQAGTDLERYEGPRLAPGVLVDLRHLRGEGEAPAAVRKNDPHTRAGDPDPGEGVVWA